MSKNRNNFNMKKVTGLTKIQMTFANKSNSSLNDSFTVSLLREYLLYERHCARVSENQKDNMFFVLEE